MVFVDLCLYVVVCMYAHIQLTGQAHGSKVVASHNDFQTGNILLSGSSLRLIDFEYTSHNYRFVSGFPSCLTVDLPNSVSASFLFLVLLSFSSLCLSVYPPVCPDIGTLFVSLTVCHFFYLSVCLFVCLSVCLSVCRVCIR